MKATRVLIGLAGMLLAGIASAGTVTITDSSSNSMIGSTTGNVTVDQNGNVTINNFAWTSGCLGSDCGTASASGAPVCTIAASPTSVASGGTTTLTATCTNTPTSYAWKQGSTAICTADTTASTCTSPTLSADATFSVTATNGTGTSSAVSTTVTVTSSTSGSGGGGTSTSGSGSTTTCGTTPANVSVYDAGHLDMGMYNLDTIFDQGSNNAIVTNINGNQIKSYQFSNNLNYTRGYFNIFSTTGTVDASISACPGDFNVATACVVTNSLGPLVYWSNDGSSFARFSRFPTLLTATCNVGSGGTMYFNVKNDTSSVISVQFNNVLLAQ